MSEAGHFKMANPANLWVLYHGQPVQIQGVQMVDPRFEFMNVPMPQLDRDDPRRRMSSSNKFMGQFTFSLPIVDPEGKRVVRWIVVPRDPQKISAFGGGEKAYIAPDPEGVRAPLDWADHADMIGADQRAIMPTYGGNVADVG